MGTYCTLTACKKSKQWHKKKSSLSLSLSLSLSHSHRLTSGRGEGCVWCIVFLKRGGLCGYHCGL